MIAGLMARTDSQRGKSGRRWPELKATCAASDVGMNMTDGETRLINPGVTASGNSSGIVNWACTDGSDDFGSEWKYPHPPARPVP